MKIFTIKLMVSSLFIFLNIITSSSANSCKTINCSQNSSVYTNDVSVHSPFRLKPMQGKHCGDKGFDLYCDDTLGTLIRLPNDIVLHVDYIHYYREILELSDPYDNCLPEKLMSLYLEDTPFHVAHYFLSPKKFWLYNCSVPNYGGYDQIDCLSGSSYTVISAEHDIIDVLPPYICTFLKNLTVSSFYTSLSTTSSINLSWSELVEEPSAYSTNSGSPVRVIVPLMGTVIPLVIIILCCYRCWFRKNEQATTTTMNNHVNQDRVLGTTSTTVDGLDPITIDSYPVVVIGASGQHIELEDANCPICLSDYTPRETLKMLPECLHRFHVDCIDQWLSSQGSCPICRASTPRHSSHY